MKNLEQFVSAEITAILLRMLLEALPLARRALIAGGVEIIDQESFWASYRNLEKHFDADAEDLECPLGLMTICEKLEDLVLKEDRKTTEPKP